MNQANLSPVLLVVIFAALNEAIMEYIFGSVDQLHPYLPLLSLTVAILLTFIYQINLFAQILNVQTSSPFLDFLLSAFIISRLSNFINDLAQKLLDSK